MNLMIWPHRRGSHLLFVMRVHQCVGVYGPCVYKDEINRDVWWIFAPSKKRKYIPGWFFCPVFVYNNVVMCHVLQLPNAHNLKMRHAPGTDPTGLVCGPSAQANDQPLAIVQSPDLVEFAHSMRIAEDASQMITPCYTQCNKKT